LDSVQHAGHCAADRQASNGANDHTHTRKRRCLADYPLKDALTLRPERESNSDFLGLSLDSVGDHAIYADTHDLNSTLKMYN
jgi:hypothetical protein